MTARAICFAGTAMEEGEYVMGLKGNVKKVYRKLRACYSKKQSQKKFRTGIAHHYQKTTDMLIPDLTEEKKREIEEYWTSHGITLSSTEWHRLYYAKTGIENPRFVPDDVFHRVIRPKMNDYKFTGVWSDKAYLDFFLRGVNAPRSVVRNVNGRFLDESLHLIDMEQAQNIMDQYETLVIKPSTFTDTGKGVQLLKKPFSLATLKKQYKKDFVIQIPLRQHADMAKLNASSINTIRVNSVLLDTEVHVMSAFVKVGQAGEFADNSGHDRYFIGIGSDGKYKDYAIDHDLNKYTSIPSGFAFAGQPVPCYEKMCRMIEKAHACVARFGFAFWDVCIREDGEPVVVEMNLRYPDSYVPQVASGPFLGEYTDEILAYIAR